MKFPLKRVILLGLGLILVYVIGNVAWFYLKYSPAEAKLKEESSHLSLPASYSLSSSTYRHGQCLDNCPLLRTTFSVNATRESVGQAVKTALESQGYAVTDYLSGSVWAQKGRIRVYTLSEPELSQGTREYALDAEQQNQPVTSLTINFEYHP